jgi:hypothetical protein
MFEYSSKVQKLIQSMNFKIAYYFFFDVIIIKLKKNLYSIFVRTDVSPFTPFVNQYSYLIMSELDRRNIE